MKIFRKSHSALLADNLLPSPQEITQDMLTQVLRVEQGSYSHPWQLGNFVDSLVSGYHMPVWWQADELLCYLVAMRGADEVHLLNFTVASDHQRQGLAQAMMHYLREWSVSREVHLAAQFSQRHSMDIGQAVMQHRHAGQSPQGQNQPGL